MSGIAKEAGVSVPHLARLVYTRLFYRETRASIQRHIDVRRLLDAAHPITNQVQVHQDDIDLVVAIPRLTGGELARRPWSR